MMFRNGMLLIFILWVNFTWSYLFSTIWLFRGILHLLKHKWRHMSIILMIRHA